MRQNELLYVEFPARQRVLTRISFLANESDANIGLCYYRLQVVTLVRAFCVSGFLLYVHIIIFSDLQRGLLLESLGYTRV